MEQLTLARHNPKPGTARTPLTRPLPLTPQRPAHRGQPRIPSRNTRHHSQHFLRTPQRERALNPAAAATPVTQIELIEPDPPGTTGLPLQIELTELDLAAIGQENLAFITRLSRRRHSHLVTGPLKAISITWHTRHTTKPAPPLFWFPQRDIHSTGQLLGCRQRGHSRNLVRLWRPVGQYELR
jgi:hypothetical protein